MRIADVIVFLLTVTLCGTLFFPAEAGSVSPSLSRDPCLGYIVTIDESGAAGHTAHVQVVIPSLDKYALTLTFVSYHGRYAIPILNLNATNEKGERLAVEYSEHEGRYWRIVSQYARQVSVEYLLVFSFMRGDEHLGYLGRNFGISAAAWTFLVPNDLSVCDVKVKFELPAGWKSYTPWKVLAPETYYSDSFEPFIVSVYAVGSFRLSSRIIGNTNVSIAVYDGWPDETKEKMAEAALEVFEYQENLFGKSVTDNYLGIFSPLADDGNPIWGGEESYGQGISVRTPLDDPSFIDAMNWFSHQIFHRWNAWEPGGMSTESDEQDWFTEGVDVYYESKALLDLRILIDNTVLKNYYRQYLQEYMGTKYDVPVTEAPKHTNAELSTEDAWKYSFIIYQKGALISLMLDIEIRRATNGEKTIDTLMSNMYSRYGGKKGSYSNRDVLSALVSLTGRDLSDFFNRYVYGTERLPLDQYFTSTSLARLAAAWKIGDTLTLNAALTDFNSNPMASEPITFYVNSVPVETIMTDSQGVARVEYVVNTAGSVVVEAFYPGTRNYTRLQSGDSFTITVESVQSMTTTTTTPSITTVTGSRVYAAQDYFPLAVGDSWKYSWTNTRYLPNPVVETLKIVSAVPVFRINATIPQRASGYFEIRRAPDGLYWTDFGTRWHSGQDPFPVPMYMILHYAWTPTKLLPIPLTVGESWTDTGTVPGRSGKEEYSASSKVIRFESVETAARTFDCILIESVVTAGNHYISGTRYVWFADGVGLVKLVYYHDEGSTTEAQLLEYGPVTQKATTTLSQSGLPEQIPGGYLTVVGIAFVAVLVIVAFSLVRRKKRGCKGTPASP